MAVLKKIKDKLIEKGPRGFLIMVFGKIQRTYRRSYFRIVGRIFEAAGLFQCSHKFCARPIGDIDLSNFSKDQILAQLLENKYQILEGETRSWGASVTPGDLLWHSDIVQNYSWDKNIIGIDLPIPFNEGDIKRPWEIGRLHQLAQLALCFRAYSESSEKKAQCKKLAQDILKNFNQENPKFNGPQWMCAMDVGIRLANISLAADLFGADFVTENQKLLNYELARHLFFIENNRENSLGTAVGNHYYADLCGLIFGYAHSSNILAQLRLNGVAKTFVKETFRQFGNDGGNFEGSTYYHRLSGEFALFSSVYFAISEKMRSRLQAILKFSKAISRPDGYVPQVGDNDSGHLFIFDPLQFQKNDLSHAGFIAGLESFLRNEKKDLALIIQKCLQSQVESLGTPAAETFGNEQVFSQAKDIWQKNKNVQKYSIVSEKLAPGNLSYYSFSEFGLFVAKSANFYFSVRCGVNAVDQGGGHRHRDQLSIYAFDGKDLVGRDPGSYIYTSGTDKRDLFRAAVSHNGPYWGNAIRREKSTFEMEDQAAQCLYFGKSGFFGYSIESGVTFYRWISFSSGQIEIVDWTDKDQILSRVDFTERYFSNQYGSYKEVL